LPQQLAINGAGLNVSQTLASALDLHRRGRLTEAELHYRTILAARPDHFDALHMLGVIKLDQARSRSSRRGA
jgi:hypothetical protein